VNKVLLTFVSTVVLSNAALAGEEKYIVTRGTEHKIGTAIGPGGDTLCVRVTSLATGAPARAKFRSSTNGRPKDLGMSDVGGRCVSSHTGTYVVYVTAVEEDLRVVANSRDSFQFTVPLIKQDN
jgi:hypothetical protein